MHRNARRLFLVDGNCARAERLGRRLSGQHLEVLTFHDGPRALLAAHEDPPDLLVASESTPLLNGHLLLEALRAEPATADTRVILLTEGSCQESLARGWKAGADLCIPWLHGEADVVATLHRAVASLLAQDEAEHDAQSALAGCLG